MIKEYHSRPNTLIGILVIALSLHAWAAPPNMVLIIGDDISVDDFGCYGHPTIRTPNVDKLAAAGLRFTNAYLTTSQCSPTRCSISVIDIAPTLLELAGLQSPPSFQGVSMTPLLNNPQQSIRTLVFAERNWHVQIAHERLVRRGDYVYIHNAHPQLPQICGLDAQCPQSELRELAKRDKLTPAQMDPLLAPRPAEELYNVRRDPHQIKNMAGVPAHRQILNDLRNLVEGARLV